MHDKILLATFGLHALSLTYEVYSKTSSCMMHSGHMDSVHAALIYVNNKIVYLTV